MTTIPYAQPTFLMHVSRAQYTTLSGSAHSCHHLWITHMSAAVYAAKRNPNPPILPTFATGDSGANLAELQAILPTAKKQETARTLLGHTSPAPHVHM